MFKLFQNVNPFRSGLTLYGTSILFRSLATVHFIEVLKTLVFKVSQRTSSFRSGLTPTALQSHPQTTRPGFLRRHCPKV